MSEHEGNGGHGKGKEGEAPGGGAPEDVVLVHGPTEDGAGVRALRSRPGKLELAELRPVKEGQPLAAREIVSLRRRKESPLLYDVKTLYAAEEETRGAAGSTGHEGPARVSSSRYRDGWEAIFARKKTKPKRGDGEPN